MSERWFLFVALAAAASLVALSTSAQNYENNLPIDDATIRYSAAAVDDPVSRLGKELENGKLKLEYDAEHHGYLPSLLARLGINPDSQALVFSKTGLQATKTSTRSPRAIYFADDVAVGMVQGVETLELAALDPRQGVVF